MIYQVWVVVGGLDNLNWMNDILKKRLGFEVETLNVRDYRNLNMYHSFESRGERYGVVMFIKC